MVVRFLTYEKLNSNSIDALELSERASNCMKRGKIYTIGDLCKNISILDKIKGCGVKVCHEVKNALFNYELQNAPDVVDFLMKVEVK